MMESKLLKIEALLRLLSMGFLVLTACLLGLDSQTKTLYYSVKRTASFKDLNAFMALVEVASVAAGYNLLQMFRCFIYHNWFKGNSKGSYLNLAWVCFLLDQTAVYVVFAANSAGVEASLIAVFGERSFQWMKLCNKYTRFCFQVGGALACGYVASLLMAVISCISASSLFRLYSPKQFLLLKGRR